MTFPYKHSIAQEMANKHLNIIESLLRKHKFGFSVHKAQPLHGELLFTFNILEKFMKDKGWTLTYAQDPKSEQHYILKWS